MISIIRLILLVVWTLMLMLIAPLFIPIVFNRQFPLMVARTVFAPVLLKIAGIKWKVIGKENVPKNEPAIYIANHCSFLDIGCLCGAIPVNLHFIAKKELVRVPIIGWYLFVAGHILVDRGNRIKSIQSIKKAAQKIREGKSVAIYPEGTRSKTGKLGAFKKGAFHLAIEAGVKIVPIAINGTYKVWKTGSTKITPGKVEIHIGKPIDTSLYSKEQVLELTNLAKTRISEMMAPVE